MTFPWLLEYTDLSLLLFRVVLALVFASSGWSHLTSPRERSESIGMSPAATAVLGFVEVVGAAGLVLGIYPQLAAVLLSGVMLGAISKKLFVWNVGFWGEEGGGWYYDLLYLAGNLVVLTTGGGSLVLT